MKKQVCTMEQAILLIAMGVNCFDTHFKWYSVSDGSDEGDLKKEGVVWHPVLTQYNKSTDKDEAIGDVPDDLTTSDNEFCSYKEMVPAFTTAELGVMLPPCFPSYVHDGHNHSHCENARVDLFPLMDKGEEFESTPAHILNKELVPIQTGVTEAEARADMLIHLLKNKYITANEINGRLER